MPVLSSALCTPPMPTNRRRLLGYYQKRAGDRNAAVPAAGGEVTIPAADAPLTTISAS